MMRTLLDARLALLALAGAALLWPADLAAARQTDPYAADEAVVATVNGDSIHAGAYRSTYFEFLTTTGRSDTPAARNAHLGQLIDTYLLAQEARRRGLEAEPDFQDVAERRIKQLVGSRYFARALLDTLAAPSDQELRQVYRRTQEQRRLRHLFFRDAAQAQAAYARLEAGADFVQLANEVYETARFDSLAGLLGLAGYWDLDDAVAEAAYATPVGSYTAPVQSAFGWHIVRVEGLLYNPLLLEADFEARRPKLAARMRERRYRLEGRHLLQQMMTEVDVEMHAEALRLLQQAARRASGGEAPGVPLSDAEVARIGAVLTPETVLASYVFEGRRYALTAGTYARWLPELPGREVRTNVAASVGRVLRDEVLAERGFAEGLDQDDEVRRDLRHVTAVWLAGRLSEHLRADTSLVPTEAELQRAFSTLGYGRLDTARADFWTIHFGDPAAARRALEALEKGEATPPAFDGYEMQHAADLTRLGAFGGHVRAAPLGQTVLLGQSDGTWALLHVSSRTLTHGTIEDHRKELTHLLHPHLARIRLLAELRSTADIHLMQATLEAALPTPQQP